MSAFQRKLSGSDAAPAVTPAPKLLELLPDHFASTWHHRPAKPVMIGLRVPSERDREGASIEALRSVNERRLDDAEQDRVIADTFTRIITARGICDPNNVLSPHPLIPLPDDQVARAFPPSTIRWLFDEIDVLNVSQSPGYREITDEETEKLIDVLSLDDPFMYMVPQQAARVRRLLWAALAEFEN